MLYGSLSFLILTNLFMTVIPTNPIMTVPREELDEKTVPMNEPDEKTVPREEPDDKTVPREEPDEKTVPREEPDDKTVPREEPDDKTVPREEPDEKTVSMEEPIAEESDDKTVPREEPIAEEPDEEPFQIGMINFTDYLTKIFKELDDSSFNPTNRMRLLLYILLSYGNNTDGKLSSKIIRENEMFDNNSLKHVLGAFQDFLKNVPFDLSTEYPLYKSRENLDHFHTLKRSTMVDINFTSASKEGFLKFIKQDWKLLFPSPPRKRKFDNSKDEKQVKKVRK